MERIFRIRQPLKFSLVILRHRFLFFLLQVHSSLPLLWKSKIALSLHVAGFILIWMLFEINQTTFSLQMFFNFLFYIYFRRFMNAFAPIFIQKAEKVSPLKREGKRVRIQQLSQRVDLFTSNASRFKFSINRNYTE